LEKRTKKLLQYQARIAATRLDMRNCFCASLLLEIGMNPVPREYPSRPLVGVGVVLLRPGSDGWRVLLIKRGRPPAEGSWSLPGGAQRVGETAEAAARRELVEETGLNAGELRLVAYVDSIHRDSAQRVQYHYTILDFTGVWLGDAPRAGGDAAELRWALEAEFDDLSLWAEARRVIAAAITLVSGAGGAPAPAGKKNGGHEGRQV
jgi:ADP-ribose pyrophosphatase YjhB (NUDIX family)